MLVEAHEARILTLQEECSGWRNEASAQQLMGDSARMLANQLGKGRSECTSLLVHHYLFFAAGLS